MSENLSILDGELRRQFAPVDRLSVDNQGGGVSRWVVADFLDISTLTASENGLYLAAEEECDCYEEVEVEVSEELEEDDYRKITGKDPNLDPNNDYAVGLDENGNLTKEMIPAAIHIVVPPRKRKYAEGETLDFSGIHVYLMDGNNRRYVDDSYPTGEIPFGELIFPVTIAGEGGGGSEPHSGQGPDTATSDLDTSPLTQPIHFGSYTFMSSQFTRSGREYQRDFKTAGGEASIVYIDQYRSAAMIASSTPTNFTDTMHEYTIDGGESIDYENTSTFSLNETYTHNGKTVYYHTYSNMTGITSGYPEVEEQFYGSSNEGAIAWTLIYGDIEKHDNNEIPVQWMRSDGETLEDTFEITIGEEGGEEPQPPDPYNGYADIAWNGHYYNINRKKIPQIHYANGYVWQEGISTEYSVEQAASLGLIILMR